MIMNKFTISINKKKQIFAVFETTVFIDLIVMFNSLQQETIPTEVSAFRKLIHASPPIYIFYIFISAISLNAVLLLINILKYNVLNKDFFFVAHMGLR